MKRGKKTRLITALRPVLFSDPVQSLALGSFSVFLYVDVQLVAAIRFLFCKYWLVTTTLTAASSVVLWGSLRLSDFVDPLGAYSTREKDFLLVLLLTWASIASVRGPPGPLLPCRAGELRAPLSYRASGCTSFP